MQPVRHPWVTSTSALLLLLASACSQGEEPKPRPADAPDVLVLVVSGHCLPIMGLCDGNFNPEYLSHAGTIDALTNALYEEGDLRVQWAAFVDGWYTWVDTNDELLAAGFVDLVGTLQLAQSDWIEGFDNPTRVVLVGHGHGAVWTHLAAYAAPDIPIDVLVDLDATSSGWDDDEGFFGVGDDWPAAIPGFVADSETAWLIDDWEAQDALAVPGVDDPQDIEDVVPPNVLLNLEVQSTPDPFQLEFGAWDGDPNWRADGTTSAIRFCKSERDHFGVYEPGSDCLEWVSKQTLRAL